MSQLSRKSDVIPYAISWLNEADERSVRWLKRDAREQRANLDGLRSHAALTRRAPTWCDLVEYEWCVRFLELLSISLDEHDMQPRQRIRYVMEQLA